MIDHRDDNKFLLGVFCGQNAALPTTATFSCQQFFVLIKTLLPDAGITQQTVDDVMNEHRQRAAKALRAVVGQAALERNFEYPCKYFCTGYCVGFLVGTNMWSRDWGSQKLLPEVVPPKAPKNPHTEERFEVMLRMLIVNHWVEVVAEGVRPSTTVIKLDQSLQRNLQVAFAQTSYVSRPLEIL